MAIRSGWDENIYQHRCFIYTVKNKNKTKWQIINEKKWLAKGRQDQKLQPAGASLPMLPYRCYYKVRIRDYRWYISYRFTMQYTPLDEKVRYTGTQRFWYLPHVFLKIRSSAGHIHHFNPLMYTQGIYLYVWMPCTIVGHFGSGFRPLPYCSVALCVE